MNKMIRIGTRESELAVWQATQVKNLLAASGYPSELIYIKSEGDIDLKTPLYEMGVQGIFTRSLDVALLNNKIDIAVHSMKDVPTQLPEGIVQAAVLKRGNYKDLLVLNGSWTVVNKHLAAVGSLQRSMVNGQWSMGDSQLAMGNEETSKDKRELSSTNDPFTTHHSPFTIDHSPFTIATSSIRRKAQWLNRFPHHTIDNLRGNVNTRMKKVAESTWNGAIFAAAGLERVNLRPPNAIELDWMLPAPAQGAVVVVCKSDDGYSLNACSGFNDNNTALCTRIEKDFLRALMGGCSTPISALATIENDVLDFKGSILSLDGKEKAEIKKSVSLNEIKDLGKTAAEELLQNGGKKIADSIRDAGK